MFYGAFGHTDNDMDEDVRLGRGPTEHELREQIKRDLEVSSFTNREGEEIFQATQPGRHGGMMGRTEDEARENYMRRIGDSS